MGKQRPINSEQAFWDNVKKTDSCWLWQGYKNGSGYGHCTFNGEAVLSHRLSYSLVNGEIPNGLLICHKCDVRDCVNPDHLFTGTAKDNCDDKIAKGRAWLSKTHCKRGHELSGDNLLMVGALRKCLACKNDKISSYPVNKGNPFSFVPFYGFSKWDIPQEQKDAALKMYSDSLGLTLTGSRLLCYILKELDLRTPVFIFDREVISTALGFKSTQSIYTALCDLLGRGIIARTAFGYKYFINPEIFPTKEKLQPFRWEYQKQLNFN